jgi:hypothetical protein
MRYNVRVDAHQRMTRLTEQLLRRIPPDDLQRIANRVLEAVDDVSANRWEAAKKRAADLPGELRPDKMKALTQSFGFELAAAGAAAGAAAAAPVVGTTATLVTAVAELGWFTTRAGDLILTVAALHGRPEPTVDERRAWVLAVLLFGGSARDGFSKAVNEASVGLSVVELGPHTRVPVATIQRANSVLTRLVLRRYGTRRGVAALGKALPLGVGAVFGGGANYLSVRALAKHADAFFAKLPYSAIDVEAVEMAGMIGDGRATVTRRDADRRRHHRYGQQFGER